MTKIGFLGAMNRDVVVQQTAARLLPMLGLDAIPLVETAISDEAAQYGAAILAGLGAATWLGGSAFNVARVVALLDDKHQHDLAFFGMAGSVDGQVPHRDALAGWGVDIAGISPSPLAPATCLAIVEASGRTLLTASGANAGIAQWLAESRNALVAALAGCDIIHVTSFLDPATPERIAGILAAAKALNPRLVVSLDPGMAWLAPGGEGLAQLMAQSRILHLNAEEFALLGGSGAISAIGQALDRNWLIVARNHAGATLFQQRGDVFTARSLTDRPPAADFVALDATGAGDTFCGGFLWAYASDPEGTLRAAELGFALARQKVAMHGPLTATGVLAAMKGLEDW